MKGKQSRSAREGCPTHGEKYQKQELTLITGPWEVITVVPPLFILLFSPWDRVKCYATGLPVTLQGQPEGTKQHQNLTSNLAQTKEFLGCHWGYETATPCLPPGTEQQPSVVPLLCRLSTKGELPDSCHSFNSCHWGGQNEHPRSCARGWAGTDRPQHPSAPYSLLHGAGIAHSSFIKRREIVLIVLKRSVVQSLPPALAGAVCASALCYSGMAVPASPFLPLFQSVYPGRQQPPAASYKALPQPLPVPPLISNPNPEWFTPAPTDSLNFVWPFPPDS